ncbi:MAG: 1,4-dihydroxy-2-naphthoate octaprenyltransferase [Flavobacteriaceae bacterium]|nr:1,4-dihydroxy-2-naphthoate octaprenyltransferase [Flavobacteriaceae bacterium]
MTKHFINAARLRTLPLSISGIIMGSFLAISNGYFDLKILIFALLTTIGLQILSNFANDYGDGLKGTDNKHRIGPKRALQSGVISPKQMLNALFFTGTATFIFAVLLIYFAFGTTNFLYSILFLVLGIASIIAAIKYTMGKNAYGYSGFGDIFVFIFFGLVSVCGSYFLYVKYIDYSIFLPAITIGLLSVGVLNLNNMRDIENDKNSNKNTLVVKIGSKKAKYYHYILLVSSLFFTLLYISLNYHSAKQFLFIIAYFPIFKHLLFVIKNTSLKNYDAELKKLALSTSLFALLFGIGSVI